MIQVFEHVRLAICLQDVLTQTFSTNLQATVGTTVRQKCCMCCTPKTNHVDLGNQQVGLHWINLLSQENRDRHPSHETSCLFMFVLSNVQDKSKIKQVRLSVDPRSLAACNKS